MKGNSLRVGQGFDVHRLEAGDGLWLGGVLVPCEYRFIAHSDGDVLLHALIDALLGATGQGDIGRWFPDTDAKYEGISSRVLLSEVWQSIKDGGWYLGNADLTIIAQAPKLQAFIQEMQQSIAQQLDCSANQINVKATTTETLGFTGRKEGIACQAIVLLYC